MILHQNIYYTAYDMLDAVLPYITVNTYLALLVTAIVFMNFLMLVVLLHGSEGLNVAWGYIRIWHQVVAWLLLLLFIIGVGVFIFKGP